ncbi:cell surface protein [Enterococcus faecalis]|uniref:WxL domain-containing protein n=1 Tax=Enterococcus faecalis TaxID=1351 RepID=UPI0009C1A524|nr:WxL domain-containing protein [Enterococcus faecalis]OQO72578.1 cell surface protein [Enterococcus faecalis]
MKSKRLKIILLLIPLTLCQTTLTVFAEEKQYTSKGFIEFIPDDRPTNPIDPNKPDPNKPVFPWDPITPNHNPNPGTEGPLSLDYASSIDFGKNKITNKDEIYYAEAQYLWNKDHTVRDESSARPNYVQVTDNRGTNAGWSLYVKQDQQLYNEQTENKELKGSQIILSEGVAVSEAEGISRPVTSEVSLVPGKSSLIMKAEKNSGAGTWIERFGTIEEVQINGEKLLKNKAIKLFVPGATPKDAVQYKSKLLWSLINVPMD